MILASMLRRAEQQPKAQPCATGREDDPYYFLIEWRKTMTAKPTLAMADQRSNGDVEKTMTEILKDLAGDRLGKSGARQVKDAAEQSIKRQEGSETLGRAIRR